MDTFPLNKQQQFAVEFNGMHVLLLAGAGTGKTWTIVARTQHLIREGVEARRILLLTFTRRAAKEMVSRLKIMVGPAASKVMAGTFHHFSLLTMRRMSKQFGIEGVIVIDRDDQVQLMKLARTDVIGTDKDFPKAAELVNFHSYARNTNCSFRAYLTKHTEYDDKEIKQIVAVSKKYEKRKRLRRYMDFDDILFHFVNKLNEDPEVRERLKGLYDHILVDEFQDTNPLQWQILDTLRDPARLYCVGDDAQSIYAFRGADFRNVHAFKKRVENSQVLKLEENYRSTQEILDMSNWLLEVSPLPYNKKLEAHRGKGIVPKLMEFDSEFHEARWVVDDLLERKEKGASWSDHMILTRTAFGSRTLEGMLIEKDIPYRFIGGTSLMRSAHVKDLICLLRAALSHSDELAWIRYLTLWPKIGDKGAGRIIDLMCSCKTFDEALDLLKGRFKDRRELYKGPATIRQYLTEPSKAVKSAFKRLQPLLETRYDGWDRRKKDLQLLIRLAEHHESLEAFIETYTLDPVSNSEASQSDEKDCVTLITVHSAKGTEAPTCYVIRAEPGMYPHNLCLGDKEQEEEERRVLYVAITRAQDELILTRTDNHGGTRVFADDHIADHAVDGTPYLLHDLPEKLVEWDVSEYQEIDEDDDFLIHRS